MYEQPQKQTPPFPDNRLPVLLHNKGGWLLLRCKHFEIPSMLSQKQDIGGKKEKKKKSDKIISNRHKTLKTCTTIRYRFEVAVTSPWRGDVLFQMVKQKWIRKIIEAIEN